MRISFASRKLENDLTDEKTLNKRYGDLADRLKRRMSFLRAANNLADVPHKPPTRRHKLSGELAGCHAVDVSGNCRIVFKADGDVTNEEDLRTITSIKIIDIINYH